MRDLEASEAIEPMLRVLGRCDAMDILYSALIEALESFGPPVLEPALAVHAAALWRRPDRDPPGGGQQIHSGVMATGE